MRQCPTCYTPNTDTSQYCESCGTPLVQGETRRPTMTYPETQRAQNQYTVPPIQYPVPEPVYAPPAESSSYAQMYDPSLMQPGQLIYPSENPENARKKSGLALFFGILLYLIGGSIAAFGVAGILVPLNNDTVVGATFIIVCLLELLVLVFLLVVYRRSLLRGWLRIVLFVCLTILAIIALVAAFVVSPSQNHTTTVTQYVALGVICTIYGLSMQIIAFV